MNTTPFHPSQLPGASWFDASSGLYQDAAGTIPATQDGDPVALWRPVVGNSPIVCDPPAVLRVSGGKLSVGFPEDDPRPDHVVE